MVSIAYLTPDPRQSWHLTFISQTEEKNYKKVSPGARSLRKCGLDSWVGSPDVLDPQLRGTPDPDSKNETDEAGSSLGRGVLRIAPTVSGRQWCTAHFPGKLSETRQKPCLLWSLNSKSFIIKRLFNIINFQLALRKWCPQKSFHTNLRIDELLKHVVDFQNWLLLMKRMVITERALSDQMDSRQNTRIAESI